MSNVIGRETRAEGPARITQLCFHTGMALLGTGMLAFGVFLVAQGPQPWGNALDVSYYIVVGILLLSGALAFVSLVRFPYGVVVDEDGLELLYFLRRERVDRAAVQALELRGAFVTRTVWLVKRDGTEMPLGLRSPRILHEWERPRA